MAWKGRGALVRPVFFLAVMTLMLSAATHSAASRAVPANPCLLYRPPSRRVPPFEALFPFMPTPGPALPPSEPVPPFPSQPATPGASPVLPGESPCPSSVEPGSPVPSPVQPPAVSVIPVPIPSPSMPPVAPGAPAPSPASPLPERGVKGAYWLSWNRRSFPSSSIDFSYFTHVFYAFVRPNATSYELVITSDGDEALPDFTATVHRQHPPLKAMLSIGGGAPTGVFAQMSSSVCGRAAFINSSVAVARKYGFDGLDLDWEFPANHKEMADLGQLFTEWRSAIIREAVETGRRCLLLTSAVYFAVHLPLDGVLRSYPVASMQQALDFINAMCFEYSGAWDTSTGAHAALYDPKRNVSTSYGVGSWIAAGMRREQVVMGLPLYGKSWRLKDPAEHGIGAPAVGTGPGDNGVLTYAQVVAKNAANKAAEVYDTTTVSAYSYAGTVWIGYDDPRSVAAKVMYARGRGLAGYFLWALSYDRNWTIASTAWNAWEN